MNKFSRMRSLTRREAQYLVNAFSSAPPKYQFDFRYPNRFSVVNGSQISFSTEMRNFHEAFVFELCTMVEVAGFGFSV